MISFEKIPPKTININTGFIPGVATPPKPKNIGVPIPSLHKQLIALTNRNIPLDQAHAAIDAHPAITDKQAAKAIASAVYKILQNSKSTPPKPKD